MNKVVLVGNVGKDPETHGAACKFTLATRGFKKGETDWHNITCFGKTAERVLDYVKKGGRVGVSGRVSYYKYTNDKGEARTVTDIIADDIEFLSSAADLRPAVEPREPREDDLMPF